MSWDKVSQTSVPVELLGIQIRDGNLDVADNTMDKAKGKLTRYG